MHMRLTVLIIICLVAGPTIPERCIADDEALQEKQANATEASASSYKAFSKTEVVQIPLADSERIILRGDNVTMRGWEGRGIKVVLEELDISTGAPVRNWQGLITPPKERCSLDKFERPANVIENEDRTAGLDLISHAGRVEILASDD
ncbi:hypothetical protein CKO51_10540 [Rhodopirellula sp. SM50]|nr:hypothetical protein [Rhodopirellula sp. SM50]PAY19548.1 hypothetical protein CKO51_10540 [Rhodopirellula sp. SM50]